MEFSIPSESIKRKHKTLSLSDKCKILKRLDAGEPQKKLAADYGVGTSTISDIKKNKEKILSFVSSTEQVANTRKTLKTSEYSLVETALYAWFLQERSRGNPISGATLQEKAKFFCSQIYANKDDFKASDHWLYNFKKRHGIRCLPGSGERLLNNTDPIESFRLKFHEKIRELELCPEQVYSATESGLFWSVLPKSTLFRKDEGGEPGQKIRNERMTFVPCSNATGSHKLRLLLVGKTPKPKTLKDCSFPVLYKDQKRGWIDQAMFEEWFHEEFVPSVREHLKSVNLPEKAILVLDDSPPHPQELVSDDGNMITILLPPFCTVVNQPIDQNVIENIKFKYRTNLLFRIIAQSEDSTLKKLNLKDVVFSIADAWNSVDPRIIQKSWKKLWPDLNCSDSESSVMIERHIKTEEAEDVESVVKAVCEISKCGELKTEQVQDWISGKDENDFDLQTDSEIISSVLKDDELETEDGEQEIKKSGVKHEDAVTALNLCIDWATENSLPPHQVLQLLKLRKKAMEKALRESTLAKINGLSGSKSSDFSSVNSVF